MANSMIGSSKEYPRGRKAQIQRHARILSTGHGLPSTVVTNQEMIDKYDLIASDRAIQFSIGIKERRHMDPEKKISDYLCRAAEMCISRAEIPAESIDRIIYCSLFGDQAIPATSLDVLQKLGIRKGIPVMDISAACSGFLHGLEMALAYINGGDDNVLILAGDHAAFRGKSESTVDTRTVFLNGDGFAAALIGHSEEEHFKCRYFYTDSDLKDFAYIPFGTELLNKTKTFDEDVLNLTMPDGPSIHKSVLDSCKIITERLFDLSGMNIEDIDFFITSDQTHLVWQDQVKQLGLKEEQSISCFHKYGNTVAGMVPLNLNEAIETGKLQRGMTLLLMGHGAGAAGGGFILTY